MAKTDTLKFRTKIKSLRYWMLIVFIFAALSVIVRVSALWHTFVTLPNQYDILAKRGVPVTATIEECGHLRLTDTGTHCRLGVTYNGKHYSWVNDYVFELPSQTPGQEVSAVLDPKNPQDIHTSYDLAYRLRDDSIFIVLYEIAVILVGSYALVILPRAFRLFSGIQDLGEKKLSVDDKKAVRRHYIYFYGIVGAIFILTIVQMLIYINAGGSTDKTSSFEDGVGAVNVLALVILIFGLVKWLVGYVRRKITRKLG